MKHSFVRVRYRDLDARQREAFNLQKIGAVLAEFGFITIPLSSDWGSADFIAQHCDGETFLKVQLKARLTFDKKYEHKDLHVCFPDADAWFIYPHDELLSEVIAAGLVLDSESWRKEGTYSFPRLSKLLRQKLQRFRLPSPEPVRSN